MGLPKRYRPEQEEPRLQEFWQEQGIYHFDRRPNAPVFSIDTPPPTVSGRLHLGHVYSYTQTDLTARFRRMRGDNVFYPLGYDDNGLPTERLVEKELGLYAAEIGRQAFVEQCLRLSAEAEAQYHALWQRLGLSIDWRHTYRTIAACSQRIAQLAFLDFYRKGMAYRRKAPTIWCPECHTAIAQAELNDLERESQLVTLDFRLPDGRSLPIATTRPELLPACVAIFVHPEDRRFTALVGKQATIPLFGQQVPILTDPAADPEKGTGAVMCCTFGDATDVQWWYQHQLPLIEAIDRRGLLREAAGEFAGLTVEAARRRLTQTLQERGLILSIIPTSQSVRVHERCDTPVEYIVTQQWFIRLLDFKETFLQLGERVNWYPATMKARYLSWVENLAWDWCVSRQRDYGVPIPLWYCQTCGEVIPAREEQLPVNLLEDAPFEACTCGGVDFTPETDVFDTWMTSSLSPQIVGGWLEDPDLYTRVYPFSLRPQAHEIIRTWAFYTLVQSHFHYDSLPWQSVAISGWGIAGEGMGKISKSRGGWPLPPMEMIASHSADAVRYWAASTGLGKDAVISEEKIRLGDKLVTKLWNVARFSDRFLEGYQPLLMDNKGLPLPREQLTLADRWILSRAQSLVRRVTGLLEEYDHAAAKSEIEQFFWSELADNYLEMSKQRLYDANHPQHQGALFTLYHLSFTCLQLFAPYLPFVTEAIYQGLFRGDESSPPSIHLTSWPKPVPSLEDEFAERAGQTLVAIATAVRRYKSEHSLPLSHEFPGIKLMVADRALQAELRYAEADLKSITRARTILLVDALKSSLEIMEVEPGIRLGIDHAENRGSVESHKTGKLSGNQ